MKAELESQDIEAIAYRVVELLEPKLSGNGKQREEDIIFDVKGLSQYLKVNESWVYKRVSVKAIPYFKNGKYTRFRKKDIDRWIDSQKIPLLTPLKRVKKGRAVN
jgi:excisionase family DNA binding protein